MNMVHPSAHYVLLENLARHHAKTAVQVKCAVVALSTKMQKSVLYAPLAYTRVRERSHYAGSVIPEHSQTKSNLRCARSVVVDFSLLVAPQTVLHVRLDGQLLTTARIPHARGVQLANMDRVVEAVLRDITEERMTKT